MDSPDGGRQTIPQICCSNWKGSISSLRPGRGHGQLQTVARAKGLSRHVQADQVTQVHWAHAVNSLMRQHTYLVADMGTDWQPVQISVRTFFMFSNLDVLTMSLAAEFCTLCSCPDCVVWYHASRSCNNLVGKSHLSALITRSLVFLGRYLLNQAMWCSWK